MATTHPIASDLSYLVLLKRKAEQAPHDSTNRRLHRVSGYRQFIPDVDERGDSVQVQPRVANEEVEL